MKEGYTQKEVAEQIGVKHGTIAFYANNGYITPSVANPTGRGTVRLYSERDIGEIRLLKELAKVGVSLKLGSYIITKMRSDEILAQSLYDFMLLMTRKN